MWGKERLISLSLQSMPLTSFQGVSFNENHVFPLLVVNDHKSSCHSLRCSSNEARTLLISIFTRL